MQLRAQVFSSSFRLKRRDFYAGRQLETGPRSRVRQNLDMPLIMRVILPIARRRMDIEIVRRIIQPLIERIERSLQRLSHSEFLFISDALEIRIGALSHYPDLERRTRRERTKSDEMLILENDAFLGLALILRYHPVDLALGTLVVSFRTGELESDIGRNDRDSHQLRMRMRERSSGFFAMIMKNLNIIDAFLIHQRQITLLIRIEHFRAFPYIEERQRPPGILGHDHFMIPGTRHSEVRTLRQFPGRSAARESRVFVREHPQTPIPVSAPIDQNVLLLAARLRILERIFCIICCDTLKLRELIRTLGAAGRYHYPITGNDILAQFRIVRNSLLVFFRFT